MLDFLHCQLVRHQQNKENSAPTTSTIRRTRRNIYLLGDRCLLLTTYCLGAALSSWRKSFAWGVLFHFGGPMNLINHSLSITTYVLCTGCDENCLRLIRASNGAYGCNWYISTPFPIPHALNFNPYPCPYPYPSPSKT